jgi:hypothetical protein
MSPTYSFVADLGFYRTAFARYRRQHFSWRRTILLISALAVLGLAWIYGQKAGALWTIVPACAFVGGIVGAAVTYSLTKLLFPRRIKRTPGYGGTIAVRLDDEGLHAKEMYGEAKLAWAAFNRVVRFSDGLLLLRGNTIRWLPDSALQNSTPAEALAFVRSKSQVITID